jgi:hypothetical protein
MIVVSLTAPLAAQPFALRAADGQVSVRGPRLGLLEGRTRSRLEDGRSVGVAFELTVMSAPAGPVLAQARVRFHLSYDLWEERFAVTKEGTPTQSTSHLAAPAAEDWCLRHVTVPRAALGGAGRGARVWVRLSYRVEDPASGAGVEDSPFSLRGLVDLFSGRAGGDDSVHTFEAGPLVLPD